ncbi:hypothetical protein OG729_04565 [Streptomyces sp. NBC_00210]|uniref:hypothetical protein n=1 Tax=Streptomyces sp. NBC_00210 TaxID=2903636 RepID=UPI00325083CC
MRASRALAAAAAACAAVGLSAPLAAAGGDRQDIGPTSVTVSPQAVHQGSTLTITVRGCNRGGTVTSNAFPTTNLSSNRNGISTAIARIHDDAAPGQYNLAVRCSNNQNGNQGGDGRGNGSQGEDARGDNNQGGDGRGDNDLGDNNLGGDGRGDNNQGGDGRGNNNQGGDGRGNNNQGGDGRGNNNLGGDGRGNNNLGGDGRGNNNQGGDGRGNNNQRVATAQFTVLAGRGALGGLGGSVGPSSTEMAIGAGLVVTAAVGGTLFVARRRRSVSGKA